MKLQKTNNFTLKSLKEISFENKIKTPKVLKWREQILIFLYNTCLCLCMYVENLQSKTST